MAKENTTIYIILGLLSHEDMSGYDMKKRIDASISNFWDVGYGQIYPTLKVLEKDGLVVKKSDTASKGPERMIYSITGSGRDVLKKWMDFPGEKEYVKYEILLKLFFGNLNSETENMKRILAFKEEKAKSLNHIKAAKQSLEKVLTADKAHYYFYLTALFGEHLYQAYIAWADEAVALLKRINGNNGTELKGD